MNASVSTVEQRAELNWLKYRELKDHWRKLEDGSPGEEVYDAAWDAVSTVECDLQSDMRTSVHALASVLMIQIEDEESSEAVPGVWRASLAAIRPQLVGAIAEAADRVLACAGPDPVVALVKTARDAWDRVGAAEKAEDQRLVDEALGAFHEIMGNIQETPPTTVAGARAAIEWLVQYDEPNIPETSGEYLRTLIRSPIFALEEART